MIKEIKIGNFKSIESLNLELGQLNVFVGANGSGKSNILEAITFSAAAMGGRLENLFLAARGVRISEPDLMFSAFKGIQKRSRFIVKNSNDSTLDIVVNFNGEKWVAEPVLNADKNSVLMEHEFAKKMMVTSTGNLQYDDKNYVLGQKLPEDILSKWKDMIKFQSDRIWQFLFETHLSDFMIFAPENTALRRFEEEGQIEPLNIDGKGLFKLLQKTRRTKPESFAKINEHLQVLDWFEGFEMPNDLMFTERRINIKDQFIDGVQFIDQRSANEGFLYLLFYLTLFISDETPKFFAIDNIDNAMNPKLGSELIRILSKLAKEHHKQVILTTHNPSILDGLDLQDDEQRLFVISRNKSGHTQAIRVPYRASDERLSTRFIRGSIGGLPKNF